MIKTTRIPHGLLLDINRWTGRGVTDPDDLMVRIGLAPGWWRFMRQALLDMSMRPGDRGHELAIAVRRRFAAAGRPLTRVDRMPVEESP